MSKLLSVLIPCITLRAILLLNRKLSTNIAEMAVLITHVQIKSYAFKIGQINQIFFSGPLWVVFFIVFYFPLFCFGYFLCALDFFFLFLNEQWGFIWKNERVAFCFE